MARRGIGRVFGARGDAPLFLGFALGDVVMILFWLVIDGWQGQNGHVLVP